MTTVIGTPHPHRPPSPPRHGAHPDIGINILGLSRDEIARHLETLGVEAKSLRMRANQIWHWVYHRGIRDFMAMSNVSKDLRTLLHEHVSLARPEILSAQISSDGTRKWLIRLGPKSEFGAAEIETVYIPEQNRGTLCVSSQVGCTLNCSFCHTGTQRLVRNLTAGEIISQLMIARDELDDWPAAGVGAETRAITNIVMMGMGEPLYNFENVKKALLIASDGDGIQISRRRITLSTSGVVPLMKRCGDEIGVMLAVSLHAVRDDIRNELVPINRKYPIAELLDACRTYPATRNAKRITFEYVMLKGVNDSLAEARELVRLLKGIPAKVNLIPFNPWPGVQYECSDWEQIERFAEVLMRAGYASPVRTPRGRDIMAACGQLKSATEKQRASTLRTKA